MVSPEQARQMAAGLPDVVDDSTDERLAVSVGGKGFAWSFKERVEPKAPRRPRLDILAIRCPMASKLMLVEAAPDRFFDDPHYNGFPAVLVRLPAIEADELGDLLRRAWRIQAPKALVKRIEG